MNKTVFSGAVLLTAFSLSSLVSANTLTLTDSEAVGLLTNGTLSFGSYEAGPVSSFTGSASTSQAFRLNLGTLNLPDAATINSASLTLTARTGDQSLSAGDPSFSDVRNQRSWQIVRGAGCGYWPWSPCWDNVWGWVDTTTPGVGGNASFNLASTLSFTGSNASFIGVTLPSSGGTFDITGGLLSFNEPIGIDGLVSAWLTSEIFDYGHFATTNYALEGNVPYWISGTLTVDYTTGGGQVPEPMTSMLLLTGLGAIAALRLGKGSA